MILNALEGQSYRYYDMNGKGALLLSLVVKK
jgi:hypothetical protein